MTLPHQMQTFLGQAPLNMGGGPKIKAMLVGPSLSFTDPPPHVGSRAIGAAPRVEGLKLGVPGKYLGS